MNSNGCAIACGAAMANRTAKARCLNIRKFRERTTHSFAQSLPPLKRAALASQKHHAASDFRRSAKLLRNVITFGATTARQ